MKHFAFKISMSLVLLSLTNCGKSKEDNRSNNWKNNHAQVEEAFQVTNSYQYIDDSYNSHVLFVINTNIKDAMVQKILINGVQVGSQTPGFLFAETSTGILTKQALQQFDLTQKEKDLIADQHSGGLYFYSQHHMFTFAKKGKTTCVKFIVGRQGEKIGEYEFIVTSIFN